MTKFTESYRHITDDYIAVIRYVGTSVQGIWCFIFHKAEIFDGVLHLCYWLISSLLYLPIKPIYSSFALHPQMMDLRNDTQTLCLV